MTGEVVRDSRFLLNYGLLVMTLTHTLTHVFGNLYIASFPILRDEFSLSIQQLGVLAAIPPLCEALLYLPAGMITDKVGSKRMLLVSLAFAVVGSLMAAMSFTPTMVILAASLVYLNTTAYHPASYSFTTHLFRQNARPRALGIHGAGGTLGVALGPLTMSLFIGLLGLTWRHVYLFWAVPLSLGIALILRLREESPNDGMSYEELPGGQDIGEPKSLFTKGLMILLVFVAVRTVALQIVGIFMPLFIVDERGFTVEQMGIIYGGSSLTGLLAAPAGGFLAARFGSKRWLSASVVMGMAMLILVAAAPGGILFSIAYIVYGFVGTLGMAARSTLIANLTPSSRRGVGYALLFLPSSIMAAISPLFAAGLIGLFGMWQLFPISILISVVSLAILVLGIKEP